jgi:hypothetical protein
MILHIYIIAIPLLDGMTSRIGSGSGSSSSFLLVFFVLTITFSLMSAGIFKANSSIGMIAYASKSEGSSGGDKSDDGGDSKGGDSNDKGGDKNSGSDTKVPLTMSSSNKRDRLYR